MPDTVLTDQVSSHTTTSTRGSRKWATLGARGISSASTTKIPTNDSETNENTSKTNGHKRHSTSLFRKSSTISRTNDTPTASEETTSPSLKKSRSLMNVLRSKLNSPAVLRRFRSKSRESAKQTVTEVNGHPTTDPQQQEQEEEDIKQSNPEPTTTRKSRKRDPSPMRRLANRITQLTRHHKTISPERQKKSPSKSTTNDSNDDKRKSTSPLHNKDEVEHINACYDEIRAKYFTNTNSNKRNIPTDGTQDRSLNTKSMNGSLLSNDLFDNSERISSPLPTSDDPLLRARKQANIKLNCMLSGYSLTTSFSHHEKTYGQNDLFKFNHYYDVGKRKYDYNFTNTNNRIFSTMKTRPMSKSIDSFRRTTTNENEGSGKLERINIVDNEPTVQAEKQEDVARILPDNNELVIREDSDLIKSEENILPLSTSIQETSTLANENNINSTTEEPDDEFERNFLRAVDRALGVVNKEENDLIQTNEDVITDESHLNLIKITEQALSSINNSTLFTNDEQKNEQTENKTELENTEVVDRIDEPLKNEDKSIDENLSNVNSEKPAETDLLDITVEKSPVENIAKVDNEKTTTEDLLTSNNEEPPQMGLSDVTVAKSADEDLLNINNEKPTTEDLLTGTNEKPPEVDLSDITVEDIAKVNSERPIDENLSNVSTEKLVDESSSKVDLEEPSNENLVKVDIEKPTDEVDVEKPPEELLSNVSVEESINQDSSEVAIEKPVDEDLSKVDSVKPTDEDVSKVDTEKPNDEQLSDVNVEKPIDEDLSKINTEKSTKTELVDSTDNDLIDEDILSVMNDLTQKVDEFLFEDSKVRSIND